MPYPLITAVITTHNRPDSLLRAVRSVLDQTYPHLELHIIDDASTAETQKVIAPLLQAHPNLYYWRHPHNQGLCAARNTGVRHARGQFVAFLDDDDLWKPDRLEKQYRCYQSLPDPLKQLTGVIYCGCEVRNPAGRVLRRTMPQVQGPIKDYICSRGLSSIPSTCLIPKTVLDRISPFDESLCSAVDHDLWMTLAVHDYHAYFVNEPLAVSFYRPSGITMVTDTNPRIRGVRQFIRKWTPTYTLWLGPDLGPRFARDYFAGVMIGLAVHKIANARPDQAIRIIRATDLTLTQLAYILTTGAKRLLRNLLTP